MVIEDLPLRVRRMVDVVHTTADQVSEAEAAWLRDVEALRAGLREGSVVCFIQNSRADGQTNGAVWFGGSALFSVLKDLFGSGRGWSMTSSCVLGRVGKWPWKRAPGN